MALRNFLQCVFKERIQLQAAIPEYSVYAAVLVIKLHQLRPTCSHRTYYLEYKAPWKSMRTLIVMCLGLLATGSGEHQKSCMCSEVSGEGAVGQPRAARCTRNFDSLPGGMVGLLLSAVPTVQTVWRSFHRDWITEDFCSVFFGIIESTEGAWFLCLMIWRWRQEPAGLSELWACSTQTSKKKNLIPIKPYKAELLTWI